MYGQLASWFHLLSPPSDYVDEAAEIVSLLEARVDPLETALELGSGGGNLASHLSHRWEMTLTDPSEGMLELSRTVNPRARHIVGDMRTLRLAQTFDVVIIHDAIGYMTDEVDLRAALETAWLHLRPGGAAIFLPDWVTDSFEPHTEHGGGDDDQRGLRYLEWDRDIEPDGHTIRTDYIIVTRQDGGVRVEHDVHTLGIFPRATWLELLDDLGFVPERLMSQEGLDLFIGRRPSR
jgi:hypothetical protein